MIYEKTVLYLSLRAYYIYALQIPVKPLRACQGFASKITDH